MNVKIRYFLLSYSAIIIGLFMTLWLINAIFFIDYFAGIRYEIFIGEAIYFPLLLIIGVLLRFRIYNSFILLRYLSLSFICERIIFYLVLTEQFDLPFTIIEILIGLSYLSSSFDKGLKGYIKKNK